MNALFEAWVLRQLRRIPGLRVQAQAARVFWSAVGHGRAAARPDLVVTRPGTARPLVIDTKWKIPHQSRPADDDLRQLFAYLHTFGATEGLLLYPRATADQRDRLGAFLPGGTAGASPGEPLRGGLVFLDLLPGGRPDAARVREVLAGVVHLQRLDDRTPFLHTSAPC
jgi:hypothetical protein